MSDNSEPQTVFVVGMVVYLRGDVGMETPMTIIDVNSSIGIGVGVCWLDRNKQLCTYFAKPAVFATTEQLERERMATMARRREKIEEEAQRRTALRPRY